MQLDNALGDGEAEPGAALLLGVGAVYLMELMENTCLLRLRNTRTRIDNGHPKLTIRCLGGNADLALISELDGVADEIEKNLRNAALVALPRGMSLENSTLRGSFLAAAKDSVADTTVWTTSCIE